jgi:hypothetical protein
VARIAIGDALFGLVLPVEADAEERAGLVVEEPALRLCAALIAARACGSDAEA